MGIRSAFLLCDGNRTLECTSNILTNIYNKKVHRKFFGEPFYIKFVL